jgi:hypothetical protein
MVRLDNDIRVPLQALIPKLARDNAVPVTVLRSAKPVAAALPVTNQDNYLIRSYQGEPPAYFIHGPLVFAPVKADAIATYSQLNPGVYDGNSPMLTRRYDRMRFPGEELVVVTAPMFTHKITKGYGDPVGKVVKEVNGVAIKNLRHLVETLRDCKDEYLVFRFAEERSEVLVFNRKEMDAATAEVLEENGIAPTRRGSEEMLKAWKKDKTP